MRADTDIAIIRNSGVTRCLDELAKRSRDLRPRATYRLQFHKDFTLNDARAIVPYLAQLGVSHLYASPLLQARAGSQHGYDIVDHNHLNPEIGTEDDLRALVASLRQHGMGLILDTVPNHMGVGFGDNPWWQDVLENGRTAEHAGFFDVDWNPLKPELKDKVLLPVLGSAYGDELDAGNIKINFDGEFFASYYDRKFPIDPQTVPLILEPQLSKVHPTEEQSGPIKELQQILEQMSSLPAHKERDPVRGTWRRDLAPRLKARLRELTAASAFVRTLVNAAVEAVNLDQDRVHELLEKQAYRLAHWRVSAEEINYRRFFDINDLVGLRMENPEVFAQTHKLLRRWLADGIVDGIRIDHLDGMLNPRQYLTRVQMLYAASQCVGAEPRSPLADNGIEVELQNAFGQHESVLQKPPLYCVVEKILEPAEELPEEWPVDGTSGYEFAHLVSGIFVDQRNEEAFTKLYHRWLGYSVIFDEELYHAKKIVMHTALAGEVNVLAHMLEELASMDRHARDFTRKALRDAIRETIACFPIYRTYIDERGEIAERDVRYIEAAVRRARRRNAGTARSVFEFLRDSLLLSGGDKIGALQLQFTLKFQQLTGPVMAKGLEDTVCYTYNRFLASNEVGGSPAIFGVSLDDFHRANAVRARRWPTSMLASSTHDTKRSEDVRARLDVLSEMPKQWSQQVMRWRRTNLPKKIELEDGRIAPDANEEYFLYQTLVGTWPAGMAEPDDAYLDRISAYMEKALHEAKRNLSWINPDPEYVGAVKRFIREIVSSKRKGANFFVRDLVEFLRPVQYHGALNSIAQTLVKLTAPGVPDIYQGMELLDLSLVDPDNRRPVDFERRRQWMNIFAEQSPAEYSELCKRLMAEVESGAAKLWTLARALAFRRDNDDLYRQGSYQPVHAAGDKREHLAAFARQHGNALAITAVPRFTPTLMKGKMQFPTGDTWGSTELLIPPSSAEIFENVLTGEMVKLTANGTILARELFRVFPVALLASR
ncbi:MAG TPA: malto-oligosyltrehalose synthase [Terriglobales bacterium]|nr:malto-oligosyltrehalose synthase [Terriglobales bacterium]